MTWLWIVLGAIGFLISGWLCVMVQEARITRLQKSYNRTGQCDHEYTEHAPQRTGMDVMLGPKRFCRVCAEFLGHGK